MPTVYSYKASRARPSFVIFDIRELWHSQLSVKSARMSKITNDGLAQDAL